MRIVDAIQNGGDGETPPGDHFADAAHSLRSEVSLERTYHLIRAEIVRELRRSVGLEEGIIHTLHRRTLRSFFEAASRRRRPSAELPRRCSTARLSKRSDAILLRLGSARDRKRLNLRRRCERRSRAFRRGRLVQR